ncbi:MAG: hypothetical protein ABH885_05855 [Candidatus Omnitrophota bacterium]
MMKKKSLLVIFFSCTLITLVLVVTLAVFYAHLSVVYEKNNADYRQSLIEQNADLFRKYISVSSLVVKIGQHGRFKGKPLVMGSITNRSDKQVLSLKLKISVADTGGKVVYAGSFYPISAYESSPVMSDETGNYLAPNDSVSFKHILKNCPDVLADALRTQNVFAKGKKAGAFKVECDIESLIIM